MQLSKDFHSDINFDILTKNITILQGSALWWNNGWVCVRDEETRLHGSVWQVFFLCLFILVVVANSRKQFYLGIAVVVTAAFNLLLILFLFCFSSSDCWCCFKRYYVDCCCSIWLKSFSGWTFTVATHVCQRYASCRFPLSQKKDDIINNVNIEEL